MSDANKRRGLERERGVHVNVLDSGNEAVLHNRAVRLDGLALAHLKPERPRGPLVEYLCAAYIFGLSECQAIAQGGDDASNRAGRRTGSASTRSAT
jgi:hypothetical protein